jgi:hypothetical protein
MSLLGGALLGQGRHAEAGPLIVQGYEGMKARESRIPAFGKFLLHEGAERVVRLYEAWGKPEEATAWKAKLGLPDLPADLFAPLTGPRGGRGRNAASSGRVTVRWVLSPSIAARLSLPDRSSCGFPLSRDRRTPCENRTMIVSGAESGGFHVLRGVE